MLHLKHILVRSVEVRLAVLSPLFRFFHLSLSPYIGLVTGLLSHLNSMQPGFLKGEQCQDMVWLVVCICVGWVGGWAGPVAILHSNTNSLITVCLSYAASGWKDGDRRSRLCLSENQKVIHHALGMRSLCVDRLLTHSHSLAHGGPVFIKHCYIMHKSIQVILFIKDMLAKFIDDMYNGWSWDYWVWTESTKLKVTLTLLGVWYHFKAVW